MSATEKLLNRNFLLLWQGQLVSQLGSQAYAVAMVFWLKEITGSATMIGTTMMAATLPGLLLGPLSGTLSDRIPKRRILVLCDLAAGIALCSLAAMLRLFPAEQRLLTGWLLAVALVIGTARTLFQPAINAALPSLVPRARLTSANGLVSMTRQVSLFFGQLLGGIAFRVLGPVTLFLVDGLSYLFSAASETLVKIPHQQQSQVKDPGPTRAGQAWRHYWQQTKEGFTHVRAQQGVRSLFAGTAAANFFLMPFLVLLPFYVEDHLGLRVDWYGFLIGAAGLGSLTANLLGSAWQLEPPVKRRLMLFLLPLQALAFGGVALATGGPAALPFMFLIGFSSGLYNLFARTILQWITPAPMMGRVMGFYVTVASGLMPLGLGLSGLLADVLHHNIPQIFAGSAIALLACALFLMRSQRYRSLLATDPRKPLPA